MKKLLKIVAFIIGALLVLLLGIVAYISIDGIPTYKIEPVNLTVEITPERVAQGQKIASMECIACHAGEDGRLTGRLLKELPPEFGTIYSRNITQDKEAGIGNWTDGEIYNLLRTGIGKNGQYIPPYMAKFPLASDEDLYSVIAWLRSDKMAVQATTVEAPPSSPSFLTKFLAHIAFKPLPLPKAPIPNPDTADQIDHGKYLATAVYGCYACHSADFKTLNEVEPEKTGGYFGGGNKMLDMNGQVVVTSNLTFDPTGLAAWSEEEFLQATKYGKRKNGKLVRYPMFPHTQLSDKEVGAIYAFLKTVPPIQNQISETNP